MRDPNEVAHSTTSDCCLSFQVRGGLDSRWATTLRRSRSGSSGRLSRPGGVLPQAPPGGPWETGFSLSKTSQNQTFGSIPRTTYAPFPPLQASTRPSAAPILPEVTHLCRACREPLWHCFDRRCSSCGSFQSEISEECARRLALARSIDSGFKEATRRSHACSHACSWVSIAVRIEQVAIYRTCVRSCVYVWFVDEYPPAVGVTHEVFHYPA